MGEISELHRQVLIFEATWRRKLPGVTRGVEVRRRFGFNLASYQRLLDEACALPEAMDIAPAVIRRRQADSERLAWRRR